MVWNKRNMRPRSFLARSNAWDYDFRCSIVNLPLLSGDVPRLPSFRVYISQRGRMYGITEVIAFVVNAGMNITANNFDI